MPSFETALIAGFVFVVGLVIAYKMGTERGYQDGRESSVAEAMATRPAPSLVLTGYHEKKLRLYVTLIAHDESIIYQAQRHPLMLIFRPGSSEAVIDYSKTNHYNGKNTYFPEATKATVGGL